MSSPEPAVQQTIGFDGSRLTGRPLTGTETYSLELLRRISAMVEPDELVVYLNSATKPDFLPEGPVYRPIPQRRLWTHVRLAREMESNPPGVLFVPAHVIPLRHPRAVVTIHDLAIRAAPDVFSAKDRAELDAASRWNCRAATRIIAVSQRTREDIIDYYGVSREKISVIHHGVDQQFRPASRYDQASLLDRYALQRPFLLCVGTQHDRKNIGAVISSFEILRDRGHDIDLVIAGNDGPATDSIRRSIAASRHSSHIRLLGFVPLEDMPALYSAAEVFVLLSWYEGFGLPALEAMSCGTAVVASESGSLPEICGPAARYAPPSDVEGVVAVLDEVLSIESARQHMIETGHIWCRRFTWDRSARMTLKVLRAVRDGTPLSDDALSWSEAATAFLARDLERTA